MKQFRWQICFLFFLCISSLVCGEDADEEAKLKDVRVVVVEEIQNCEQRSKQGDFIVVRYTAEYTDPDTDVPTSTNTMELFDDSESYGDPVYFNIGQHEVMKGWEDGLVDMCVGEKRDLYLSGSALEGDRTGQPKEPEKGREVLYHFELVKITNRTPTPNLFKKMDYDKDNAISKSELLKFAKSGLIGGLEKYGSLEDGVQIIFDGQDANGDGMITFEEFNGPKHTEF